MIRCPKVPTNVINTVLNRYLEKVTQLFPIVTNRSEKLSDVGCFGHTVGGKRNSVTVRNVDPFSVIADKDEHLFTTDIRLSRYFAAPVSEGEALGEVVFFKDGEEIGSIQLVAEGTVEKSKN